MANKETMLMLELANDKYIPLEANELIESLIDARLHLYNIQKWRKFESNHQTDETPIQHATTELRSLKKNARELIAAAREKGLSVDVSARIEIRIANKQVTNTQPESLKSLTIIQN